MLATVPITKVVGGLVVDLFIQQVEASRSKPKLVSHQTCASSFIALFFLFFFYKKERMQHRGMAQFIVCILSIQNLNENTLEIKYKTFQTRKEFTIRRNKKPNGSHLGLTKSDMNI